MKTHNGQLRFGKKEEAEMRCVLEHAKIDIGYAGGGTYNKHDNDNSTDDKEIAKARRGIESFEWILETYK